MAAKIKAGDLSFLAYLAETQHQGGAEVLGVNLGVPGTDEVARLTIT